VRAGLRAVELEKIQKKLNDERPAIEAAKESKKERDIKKELRAGTRATSERDMWPSLRKELKQKFIKKLTEGLDTESANNAADKQPPVAKQAQAVTTHSVSIQDVVYTQGFRHRAANPLSLLRPSMGLFDSR
jgi:hypothetical protein